MINSTLKLKFLIKNKALGHEGKQTKGFQWLLAPFPNSGTASALVLAQSSKVSFLHSAHSLTPWCPRVKLAKGWPSTASAVKPMGSLHLYDLISSTGEMGK